MTKKIREKLKVTKDTKEDITDPPFMLGVLEEIEGLYNIVRDIEYKEICVAAEHQLGLCTECTWDINRSVKNIEKYKKH